ncbi:MAG: DinB family protein [Anaerolineales bacterium]|nr:DinB family protein [Anaerolineales bacterium]
MSFDFIQENDRSRERLETFIRSLSTDDFTRTNAYGWTIAALLGHLAFWDNRVLVLLRRWQEQGVDESPVDPDMINDSLRPICLALEPRAAADLCLASAKEVDAALATVSPELVAAIQASPNHFRFDRSLHRDDHLGEIARILERSER